VRRIDAGLEPACVHHCPAKCMYFGDINDLTKIIQDKKAKHMVEKQIDKFEFSLGY
jgi:Fe-S-cluster-containing dehydrogenase component